MCPDVNHVCVKTRVGEDPSIDVFLLNMAYISAANMNPPFWHRRERVKPLLPMLNPSLWAGAVLREDT